MQFKGAPAWPGVNDRFHSTSIFGAKHSPRRGASPLSPVRRFYRRRVGESNRGRQCEDNSIRGLGEAGVVLVGGSTFIHRRLGRLRG